MHGISHDDSSSFHAHLVLGNSDAFETFPTANYLARARLLGEAL